jgi:hypothetical protein
LKLSYPYFVNGAADSVLLIEQAAQIRATFMNDAVV